jgi:biotin carboxyl carrier protein
VGLFQPSAPGRPKLGDEGLSVKEGDALGQVETGAGQPHVVRSPCAGRVARVFVSAGQAVQYGQPLFFLERA